MSIKPISVETNKNYLKSFILDIDDEQIMKWPGISIKNACTFLNQVMTAQMVYFGFGSSELRPCSNIIPLTEFVSSPEPVHQQRHLQKIAVLCLSSRY